MIHRFNCSMRRSDENLVRPEIIIQFTQFGDLKDYFADELGQPDPRAAAESSPRVKKWVAGATVVADIEGRIRHVIVKPLPLPQSQRAERSANKHHLDGAQRLDRMLAWMTDVDNDDPLSPWEASPAVDRLDFASLHTDRRLHEAMMDSSVHPAGSDDGEHEPGDLR